MQFEFYPGQTQELFVLFHGTGGNEDSLLPIAGDINPQAAVLTFLGDYGRGVKRHFFKPLLANGQVDQDDLDHRVQAFAKEWADLRQAYANYQITFLGFSNGANFLLALLAQYPDLADRYILLHPSNLGYAFKAAPKGEVILTAGASDDIAPAGGVVTMDLTLKKMGANSQVHLYDGGHGVSQKEIDDLKVKVYG